MNAAVIAIDIDSVLFPINERVILPAFAAAGLPLVQLADITDFDYAKCLGNEYRMEAFSQFRRADLYDNELPPVSAQNALRVLRRTYEKVICVSSPFAQHASSKWRFAQRAGFSHEEIVLAGDKSLVYSDVLVDDRAETALELGPDEVVLFDRPWNRGPGMEVFTRAYGWDDVTRKVARLVE